MYDTARRYRLLRIRTLPPLLFRGDTPLLMELLWLDCTRRLEAQQLGLGFAGSLVAGKRLDG